MNSRSVGIHSELKASLCYQECDSVSEKKAGLDSLSTQV